MSGCAVITDGMYDWHRRGVNGKANSNVIMIQLK